MPALADTRLVVFLTRGMSLGAWERQGVLERELALFRALRQRLAGLSIVSYGGQAEPNFAARLPEIELLYNRWRLPGPLYAALAPRLHARALAGAAFLRTNQMKGAEAALAAQHFTGAQLVVRCGYLWSQAAAQFREGWRGQVNYSQALRTERAAFPRADAVILTTEDMKRHVAATYAVPPERIHVIPNFVLDGFFEARQPDRARRVLYVGRLEPDKDPAAVIEAARGLDAEVRLIGQGSLRPQLEQQAAEAGVPATFIPRVPHGDLPQQLAEASVFMLPSPREGHPKTLIEAMAAARPVVGRDAPGIRDVIQPETTGLLAGDAGGFRAALQRLLDDPALRQRLGSAAREYARAHFTLEKAVAAETALLERLASRGRQRRVA
jgi:glycosyltransferase involved in cell wall biosynthesis